MKGNIYTMSYGPGPQAQPWYTIKRIITVTAYFKPLFGENEFPIWVT
jgi:hypothetical protein